jgi:DNA-binding transcriptional MocR family regulator
MSLTRPLGARPEDRYTRLPDALLSVLSPREHQVIHLLLSYRWTDDALIYPSVPTMAARLGCSERTIQRTAHELERRGYLIIEARYRDDQGQCSNVYHPGPLLVALLSSAGGMPVTRRRDDHHPPVTRAAYERDSGNQKPSTRRPERVNTDPAAFTSGALSAYVRT